MEKSFRPMGFLACVWTGSDYVIKLSKNLAFSELFTTAHQKSQDEG